MTLLSTHLSTSVKEIAQQDVSSTSYAAGICSNASITPHFSSMKFWIINSGASRHICSNSNAFTSLKPIWNSSVTLPNKECILVHLYGDVKLTSDLLLRDVLLSLSFNLIFFMSVHSLLHLLLHSVFILIIA